MLKKSLFNLIRKYHHNISIYPAEIFERRCQEEIIRSDEDKTSFVYLEFDFQSILSALQTPENEEIFWRVFFSALEKNRRGSDILGFLENDTGLGFLLLDSKIEGWLRIKGRVEQAAKEFNFNLVPSILTNSISPIVYPTCVQDSTSAISIP